MKRSQVSRVRVKICGITTVEDAEAAVRSGADAIGFVFTSSPRKITPSGARLIAREIPPMIQKVGVFTNESPREINSVCDECTLDWVQLHGSQASNGINRPVIRALRLKGNDSLQDLSGYNDCFLLIDSFHPSKMGGTGLVGNWDLAAEISLKRPIILAGGLTPDNVREAILRVKPYAVDVSSGVEKAPGKKDPYLIEIFMNRVKESNHVT